MHIKRAVTTFVGCSAMSLALFAGTAQAAGPTSSVGAGIGSSALPAMKKPPKPTVYEWCGSESGCGYETDLWKKSKTWGFFGEEFGTYFTGHKGLLVLEQYEYPYCVEEFYKVKKSKNYFGFETSGEELCYIGQAIELIRL
jgi:hypothetical protein